MLDLYVTPLVFKVLCNEPPMAMMRLVLTAKKASAIKLFAINFFDLPLRHEVEKFFLVFFPRSFVFFEAIQDVLGPRPKSLLLVDR